MALTRTQQYKNPQNTQYNLAGRMSNPYQGYGQQSYQSDPLTSMLGAYNQGKQAWEMGSKIGNLFSGPTHDNVYKGVTFDDNWKNVKGFTDAQKNTLINQGVEPAESEAYMKQILKQQAMDPKAVAAKQGVLANGTNAGSVANGGTVQVANNIVPNAATTVSNAGNVANGAANVAQNAASNVAANVGANVAANAAENAAENIAADAAVNATTEAANEAAVTAATEGATGGVLSSVAAAAPWVAGAYGLGKIFRWW